MSQDLDLTPDPRVLQMLGEINLPQWRCLAELIDNGIDGLMQAARGSDPIEHPEIAVQIPTGNKPDARVVVRDNGPGMSIDVLEKAVKAGWSGNNPINNLGLFGMGFNIATARLGLVTEVWTTRAGDPESVGLRIDLDALRANKNFRVPRQTRPKVDHLAHGTEIIITRLKPDQLTYLSRANNLTTVKKHLAKAYSSILQSSEAGTVRLTVNGVRLRPRRHCFWDPSRSIELSDGSAVSAVEEFNVALAPRRYCTYCMRTLRTDEKECPTKSKGCTIEETERRVWGWVGLQRYLHKSDFGIDFVRNGRKIEIGSMDLFSWNDGNSKQLEYPIDDPRGRGRFVGEVHLDHCRVSYTKDRFERDDPSWGEMVRIVRGEGPMQPQLAKQNGYSGNTSPLYRLFQAFRRSSPKGKNALWSRLLVVKDNDRSEQMATSFYENQTDFIDDERWWQLVEEQDREILGPAAGSGGADIPGGFLDGDNEEPSPEDVPPEQPTPVPEDIAPEPDLVPEPERQPLHELTRKYTHPSFRVEHNVEAYSVVSNDPELGEALPWLLKLDDVATRTYAFYVDQIHPIFQSSTMTPLDALLTELSFGAVEFLKGQISDVSLANVLSGYRLAYCSSTRLDPSEIISLANSALSDFARALPNLIPEDKEQDYYAELDNAEQEQVSTKMAARGVTDRQQVIKDGRFWEYMDFQSLPGVFLRHPELFFDGKYWVNPYDSLDFGPPKITTDARQRVIAKFEAYLGDAVWLASQTSDDLERSSRDAIIRATCSLRLLRPDRSD